MINKILLCGISLNMRDVIESKIDAKSKEKKKSFNYLNIQLDKWRFIWANRLMMLFASGPYHLNCIFKIEFHHHHSPHPEQNRKTYFQNSHSMQTVFVLNQIASDRLCFQWKAHIESTVIVLLSFSLLTILVNKIIQFFFFARWFAYMCMYMCVYIYFAHEFYIQVFVCTRISCFHLCSAYSDCCVFFFSSNTLLVYLLLSHSLSYNICSTYCIRPHWNWRDYIRRKKDTVFCAAFCSLSFSSSPFSAERQIIQNTYYDKNLTIIITSDQTERNDEMDCLCARRV